MVDDFFSSAFRAPTAWIRRPSLFQQVVFHPVITEWLLRLNRETHRSDASTCSWPLTSLLSVSDRCRRCCCCFRRDFIVMASQALVFP